MQLNLGTTMRQELSISPRMIQSMEILQLPVMALQERIEHELQENPVLEERGSGDEDEVDPNGPEVNEIVEPSPESAPEMPEQ